MTDGMDGVREIFECFDVAGVLREAGAYGHGHIHDTYLARFEEATRSHRYIFQRLNTRVFPSPTDVMHNVNRVIRHLQAGLASSVGDDASRRCLRLLPTREGESHHVTASGEVWRSYHFVEGSCSLREVASFQEAQRAARAFGRFAAQLADLPITELRETLPGFHDLDARLQAFERAREEDLEGRGGACTADQVWLDALSLRVEALREQLPQLPLRPVHNDCKLDNLLVDRESREPLCVVDLDTVMPGHLLADFGELTRSAATRSAEDERDLSRVDFDLERFAGLAVGYLEGLEGRVSAAERAALPLAGPLLTLENATRFLADHLNGDVYFRIHRSGHNLDRARCQLRLLECMLDAQAQMQETLGDAG